MFSLEDFMELEFKSCLCICEQRYLKLVHIPLFEGEIDGNSIFDRKLFNCQALINSGMMAINLTIMKSFINDRNSFMIEERINLHLNLNANLDLDNNNSYRVSESLFYTLSNT